MLQRHSLAYVLAVNREIVRTVQAFTPSGRRRFILELQVAVAKALVDETFGSASDFTAKPRRPSRSARGHWYYVSDRSPGTLSAAECRWN